MHINKKENIEHLEKITGENPFEQTEIIHDSIATFNSESEEWESWFQS
jgi:hypothetical protein